MASTAGRAQRRGHGVGSPNSSSPSEEDGIGPGRHCRKAISYNNLKLIMKTENGGFSTFAGVFDPGNGRIGPALLKVRLAFLRDASNGVCRFFRRGVLTFADTP